MMMPGRPEVAGVRRVIAAAFVVALLGGCEMEPGQAHPRQALPEPEAPGAKVLEKYCSDCHAPPQPSVHEAREWPNIVYRMQERRRMKAYSLMSDEEKAQLTAYLQRHARKEPKS